MYSSYHSISIFLFFISLQDFRLFYYAARFQKLHEAEVSEDHVMNKDRASSPSTHLLTFMINSQPRGILHQNPASQRMLTAKIEKA